MTILAAQPDFIITDEDGILIGSSGGTSLLTGGTEGQAPIVQGDGSIAWGAAGASSLSELDDWVINRLTFSGEDGIGFANHSIYQRSGANKYLQVGDGLEIKNGTNNELTVDPLEVIVNGTLIARQSGGVAGTDEVQIYHDGTDGFIESQSGDLRMSDGSNDAYEFVLSGKTATFKDTSEAFGDCYFDIFGGRDDTWLRIGAGDSAEYAILSFGYMSSGSLVGTWRVQVNGSQSQRFGIFDDINDSYYLFADPGSNQLVIPQTLIIQQPGGVAGTDEVQISHDGSNGLIASQSGDLWLDGGITSVRIYNGRGTNQPMEIMHNDQLNWQVNYNSIRGYHNGRDYEISKVNGGGNLTLRSDFGDLILQPNGTAQGDIYLKQDTHLEGTLKVLQPGGVAGTDEVQIYHDGSNAYIDSQSGLIRINSTSNAELQINGSTNWTFKYNSLQASNSATRDYAILRAGGAGDLILGADQGDLILQPDGTAQGDIYLKQDTHLEGTLKVLQPGGVSGTDELQIYHDGTDAYVVPQSGALYFTSAGANGPQVNSSGELANVGGGAQCTVYGVAAALSGPKTRATVVGYNAGAGGESVAIGTYTYAGSAAVAIGAGLSSSSSNRCFAADNCTVIGYQAQSNFAHSVVIGRSARSTASYQLVIGTNSNFRIEDVYIGRGVTNVSPSATTYHATGGSGTDIAGASLYLAGGKGTGSGAGGNVIIQHAPAGASGTSLNSLVDVVKVDSQGLTVLQPGGVAGTDEVQIYHDGTDAHIIPQSGNLDLNGYAVGAHNTDGLAFYRSDGADDFHFAATSSNGSRGFHVQGTGAVTIGNKGGSAWYDFEMKGGGLYLNSNNKYIQILSGYLAWDTAKTLLISEGDGRNGHANGQGRIAITTTVDSPSFLAELTMSGYNSMNLSVAVEGTLIARQDGGVAGTDEIQIYHDGSNAYVVPQSGSLYFTSAGSSGPQVTSSGDFSNNGGLSGVQIFGENNNVTVVNSIALGNNNTCQAVGNNIAIGQNCNSSAWSAVAIGSYAIASGEKSIAISASNGSYAQSAKAQGLSSVAIGNNVTSGTLGENYTICIGSNAVVSHLYSIGLNGSSTSNSQFVVGKSTASISDVYIGNGVTASTPEDTTYHATGGSGTDVAGASLYLAGGMGTGSGAGGDVVIQHAPAGSSGSSLNSLVDVVKVDSQGLTVLQPGGVAGTDEVQIYHDGSNAYIDSQSGDLIFNNSTAKVNSSGEFTNNNGITGNEAFGSGTTGAIYSVAIGYAATAAQSSVVIGYQAEAEDLSIAIGMHARDLSSIGRNVLIGAGASVSGINNIIIGSENKSHGAISNTKIIGRADALYGVGSGQFIGGTPVALTTDVYFGRGPQYTAVEDYTIHGTGGYGTDIDGSSVYLAGGMGTGTGVGGDVIIQHAPAGSSGSSLNSLVDVVKVDSQGLTVLQPGGVAGTDEVQIYHDGSNAYIANQSGDVYITTAGNNSLYVDAPGGAYYQFRNNTYQYAYAGGAWKFYAGGFGTQQIIMDLAKNDIVFYRDARPLNRTKLGTFEYGFSQLALHEQSADPTDPNEGHCIIWQSDGTGSGDDGDIMMKITAGGVTKTTTLVDFSTL